MLNKIEQLQATIDVNNMMYKLTGQTDYLKNAQEAWKLLKSMNAYKKQVA